MPTPGREEAVVATLSAGCRADFLAAAVLTLDELSRHVSASPAYARREYVQMVAVGSPTPRRCPSAHTILKGLCGPLAKNPVASKLDSPAGFVDEGHIHGAG